MSKLKDVAQIISTNGLTANYVNESVTRKDCQLIADALDIVSPDNSEVGERARELADVFHRLAAKS